MQVSGRLMPGPTSDKAQELSNKTTKSSKRPSRSNQGGTSIAQQAKGSKAAFSIAKPEIPAKFDKKSQLREAQEQEWDIDTLFATTKKAKKKDDTAAQDEVKGKSSERPKKKQKIQGSKDNIFGKASAQNRRRTEEGYVIYSEQELSINTGGGTDKCPFDCQCCF